MDEELRAFLTERFDAIDQRFGSVGQQFAELRREVDQRFTGIDQQFADLRRELDQRFVDVYQRIDGVRRELGVVVEQQQDQIRLIAEGHATLLAAIERLQRENAAEHQETRAMIKLSYAEMDRRITRLEALTVDLEARLSRLEQER